MARVAVVYGSESDEGVMRPAVDTLAEFGIECETKVISAHRQPDATAEFARTAASRGIKVVIAGAGLAAALPGVVAAHTTLPVIGVPMASSPLGGVDALLAMVQMPPGVPVATVSIGKAGARNAALLAVEILALSDAALGKRLEAYRSDMRRAVLEEDAAVRKA